MKTRIPTLLAFLAALALTACGDKHEHGDEHDDHAHAAKNGGLLVETSGHDMHFEVKHDDDAGLIQVWIYDGEMQPIETAAPSIQLAKDSGGKKLVGQSPSGGAQSHEWHFADKALDHGVHGRLRLKHGGKSYNVDLPEHGHEHAHGDHGEHGPHDGMVAAFMGPDGKEAGHIELKLHDDKGDLELWIATDDGITKPFDLPLDATIAVAFPSMSKDVTLAVRNKDQNEDEDGAATVRDGKTNYFIFPGDTGADAAWLVGKDFKARVTVSFTLDGTAYTTKPFELVPHGHDDAHGHEHK